MQCFAEGCLEARRQVRRVWELLVLDTDGPCIKIEGQEVPGQSLADTSNRATEATLNPRQFQPVVNVEAIEDGIATINLKVKLN